MPVEGVKKSAVSVCVLVIILSVVLTSIAVTSIINKFNHDADITFAATLFASDVIAPGNYFKHVDEVVKKPVIEVPLISEYIETREPEVTDAPSVPDPTAVPIGDAEEPPVGVEVGEANVEPDYIGKGYVYIREDGCIVYRIVYGDTLWAISKRVGVSIYDLGEYNNIADLNLIYSDTELLIPPDKYPGYDVLFGLTLTSPEVPEEDTEFPEEFPVDALPVDSFEPSDERYPEDEPN